MLSHVKSSLNLHASTESPLPPLKERVIPSSNTSGLSRFSAGGALEMEEIDHSQDAYAFNITRCGYAEFYKKMGVPELGFLLSCSRDFALTEGMSPDLQLTRTQTIMQGAGHCDFRFRLKSKANQ